MFTDKLLVSTKFAPPRLGMRSILRRKLLEELGAMARCRIGLVIGSPGFGKTTLLAQWRQVVMKTGAEVVWLSLSVDDRSLSSFFVYFVEALQRLGVNIDSNIPLDSANGDSVDYFVASVVEGASNIKRELYVVLDDYHHVTDSRSHRLLQKLLEHCPDNLHFLIAARTNPPFNLGRLRLMGQVLELDCAGLPFDLGETRAFLEVNSAAMKLSSEEVHQLHELTSGWPASLQLIAILSRNRSNTSENLRELGWESDNLQAYLAEDVMSHLPADMARFMEEISICRRFNAGLSKAVTGCDDAARMLERLEEENLLIYRVEKESWYRFHPLFSEFLATRLARRKEVSLAELHRRAAHWLDEHSLFAEAVRHAIQSEDLEYAADLVQRLAPSTWGLDYLSPLLRLLDLLPQDVLFSRPRLFFLGCLAYSLTARPAKAEAWLEQYRRSGVAQPVDVAHRLPLVQAAIEIQRDRSEAVITLLEQFQALPDDYSIMRYGCPSFLALAYCARGDYVKALHCLDQLPQDDGRRSDEVFSAAGGIRIFYYQVQGRMNEAVRLGTEHLQRVTLAHGHRSMSAHLAAAMMVDVYYELDRLDEAREVLANRTAVLLASIPAAMLLATVCRARLDLLQESPLVALQFLERQERHFRSTGQDRAVAYTLAETVRIALLNDDGIGAVESIARLDRLANTYRHATGFQAEIPIVAALARARLLLSKQDAQGVLDELDAVRQFADDRRRGQLQVTVAVLRSLALKAVGEEADETLLAALALGARLGLVRSWLDEGEQVRELLEGLRTRVAEQTEEGSYLADLLVRFTRRNDTEARSSKLLSASQVSLTPREVAILQLISQAMTNKRVALTLSISLETVKWNLKNIYQKLGVSSRYEAMTLARKLELIP